MKLIKKDETFYVKKIEKKLHLKRKKCSENYFKLLQSIICSFSKNAYTNYSFSFRKYINGVDRFDQQLQFYAYPHKFKKWWSF